MVELLQSYGDSVSPSCRQQLVNIIKHGHLLGFHFHYECKLLLYRFKDVEPGCFIPKQM